MSKKVKSPGQKRKAILKVVIFVLALAIMALGGFIEGKVAKRYQELVAKHETADAEVTGLKHDVKTIRKRRRTKEVDVYTLSYQFDVTGKKITNNLDITEIEFNTLQGQPNIEVWYSAGNPEMNGTPSEVNSLAGQGNFYLNAGSLGIIVLPLSVVAYFLIAMLFIREPKGILPEGFVRENSWLDVDDEYLVGLAEEQIIIAKLNEKKVSEVQKLYQQDEPLEKLLEVGASSVEQIPLISITEVKTGHHEDTLTITYGEKGKVRSVEFLNPTVKEHALERIVPLLNPELSKSSKQLTRLQAAMPSMVSFLICCGMLYYFENIIILMIGGLALFFAIKTMFARLIDPTLIMTWTLPEEAEA